MLYAGPTPVLTQSDFSQLMQALPADFEDPSLTALYLGLDVDPKELALTLNVSVRLAAASDAADAIINRALSALDDSAP